MIFWQLIYQAIYPAVPYLSPFLFCDTSMYSQTFFPSAMCGVPKHSTHWCLPATIWQLQIQLNTTPFNWSNCFASLSDQRTALFLSEALLLLSLDSVLHSFLSMHLHAYLRWYYSLRNRHLHWKKKNKTTHYTQAELADSISAKLAPNKAEHEPVYTVGRKKESTYFCL